MFLPMSLNEQARENLRPDFTRRLDYLVGPNVDLVWIKRVHATIHAKIARGAGACELLMAFLHVLIVTGDD